MTLTLILTTRAHAHEGQVQPVRAPRALVAAREACPNDSSIQSCRAALRRAYQAIEWQKTARIHDVQRVLDHTRGHQPFAYSARIAYAACITFAAQPAACRPPGQMLQVGRCESGLQIHNPNPTSTADSWLQYLDSTWRNQPIARLNWFSRFDPIAVAIAAEGMSRHGWGAWRASRYCHGLS